MTLGADRRTVGRLAMCGVFTRVLTGLPLGIALATEPDATAELCVPYWNLAALALASGCSRSAHFSPHFSPSSFSPPAPHRFHQLMP